MEHAHFDNGLPIGRPRNMATPSPTWVRGQETNADSVVRRSSSAKVILSLHGLRHDPPPQEMRDRVLRTIT
eukprot:7492318-Alexandrium_andersonii.AAC.1